MIFGSVYFLTKVIILELLGAIFSACNYFCHVHTIGRPGSRFSTQVTLVYNNNPYVNLLYKSTVDDKHIFSFSSQRTDEAGSSQSVCC